MATHSASSLSDKIKPETSLPSLAQPVKLYGHVTLLEGYALPGFVGCHALVALRDTPGVTVAVTTTAANLQDLLEASLTTGNLIAFWGEKLANPPTPRNRTWAVDVYAIDGVVLYNVPPAATMEI